MNRLINGLRVIMKSEKVLKICSVFVFWLLVASAYSLFLCSEREPGALTGLIFGMDFL